MVPRVNLVLGLICRDYYQKQPTETMIIHPFDAKLDHCRTPEVQAHVTAFKLACSLISGIIAAVVAPKLGALSDRYGRTTLMAYALSGMLVNELITITAATYPETLSVNWILLGSVFDGLSGSFIAIMAMAHSYASDCTPAEQRSVVFGYFHGCMFTGIAIGPILAGYFVKVTGHTLAPFYGATGFHLFFVFLLLFIIPESLSKSSQRTNQEKHRLSISSMRTSSASWRERVQILNIFEPLKILYGPSGSPMIRRNLMLLAAVDFIIFGVGMGAAMVVLLYSNYMFGWDQWQQSKFTSIVSSCRVLCLLLVLPAVTKWYRGAPAEKRGAKGRDGASSKGDVLEGTDGFELSVLRAAILADVLGFLGYALSADGSTFILAGAMTSVGGIGSPTLQAALTRHVPKDSVGQLLGAVGLLHALARVVGPTVFGGIYAATVGYFPQAYFVILALMYGLALGVTFLVRPNVLHVLRYD